MRDSRTRTGVVHQVVPSPTIDGARVGELEVPLEHGTCSLVADGHYTEAADDEVLAVPARLAQKLENAGGTNSVTACGGSRGARVARTPWARDLTRVPGADAAPDEVIMHRLTVGAGGEAQR
jgi:hypothetical protein